MRGGYFMSIIFNEKNQTITLNTKNSTYQMKINEHKFLVHTYYGNRISQMDMAYLHIDHDRACSGQPDEVFPGRIVSFNTFPQEFTSCGIGDFRINSIALRNEDGSNGADFRYVSHEIKDGKYSIPNLPAVYDNGGEAQTLIVTIQDPITNLKVELYYGVFEENDVICRSARIINEGKGMVQLQKASSMSLDLEYGNWDMIHFHGRHALERQVEREPLSHSIKTVGSTRGTSSHQQNPFVIICDHKANEDYGNCYGFMFVYSGGFKAEAEVDQMNSTRFVMGIQDEGFTWDLNEGEVFETPEVIMAYSNCGLTNLSHQYHHIIRHNVCRGKYKTSRRPILINNWEATYFDFDDRKLVSIAKEAKDLGVELLVLDDGWFGVRDSDNSGLGDWFVNENKIKCGLSNLVKEINEIGLKFGIWIEPEMVNEDSELYKKHPDWAYKMPGRVATRTRNQYVLDMSREDVREYLYTMISKILRENNIEYVKWDMNRSLSDLYSGILPASRQGEVAHRYVLGLYDLMDKLTSEFPHVLFEGCSGGGARFDAGILYYSPQIWCSDDTDPIHRLSIQYGTSFGYPVCTMGAHVSASPNHQTGRSTPIHTRATVAMSGTFGYELDPEQLSQRDKEEIRDQIVQFKKYYHVIQDGKYYRLTDIHENWYESWQIVSADQSESVFNLVVTNVMPNQPCINIKLKGLDPEGIYEIDQKTMPEWPGKFGIFGAEAIDRYCGEKEVFTGSALMNGGYTFPWIMGDYPTIQIHFQKIK